MTPISAVFFISSPLTQATTRLKGRPVNGQHRSPSDVEARSAALAAETPALHRAWQSWMCSIDGNAVAFLQSPGIAHPTKSKVEFGCMGKDGFFDDLKIWNADPAK